MWKESVKKRLHNLAQGKAVTALACALMLASAPFPVFAAAGAKPTVVVSILPQQEFVRRVSGDTVNVVVLVGPGASPHSYEPTPRQIASVSGAAIWFTIGVDFEKALRPKIASLYPTLRIVDTTKNVKFRTLESHEHEGEGVVATQGVAVAQGVAATGTGGLDPHTWLGREPAKAQARAIADALAILMPANAAAIAARTQGFLAEIDAVFADLSRRLAPLKGAKAFVYHPSFGYFLDEFGIAQEAVEVGGKEPTQKTLASLIALAKKEGAKIIFVQKQFPSQAATTVAKAIGGSVIEMDPLAGDWLVNLKRMGAELERTIGGAAQ